MTTKEHIASFALGMLGGAVMATGAWLVFRGALRSQFASGAAEFVQIGQRELQHTLDVEIPARVAETIDRKFSEAGITRDTGRQISILLDSLERLGVLQAGQNAQASA